MRASGNNVFAVLSIAVFATGCATTSDPYACADRGVFAVGCHDDVAKETGRRKGEIEQTQRSTAEITKSLEEKRAVEAALQSRVADLKARLAGQRQDLSDLQGRLDEQRASKQLTEERYSELTAELEQLNEKIDYYQNLENLAYSANTADELEYFLETETVTVRRKIVEGELG